MVGNDQLEHGVAQELQALVGVLPRRLRAPRPVRHGPGQQLREAEAVADPLGQRYQLLARGPGSRRLGAMGERQEAPNLATT